MASKTITLSDISGDELTDETHVRLVVKHPDINFPVSLDASTAEAEKLVSTTLRLVEFNVFEPNRPPRKVLVESKVLDKLFGDVDFDDLLASAPRADEPASGGGSGRTRSASTSRGDKVDYTSPSHAGTLHRGRVTEAEAAWVRANRDQASANREAQGNPPINWSDDAERRRYSITD